MPRYFVDLYDGLITTDDVGIDMTDLDGVKAQVRQALPTLLRDEITHRDKAHFRADVRDESGKRVLTATILMVIDDVGDAAG